MGRAEDMKEEDRVKYAELLLSRHPELEDFVAHPDCAVMRVTVEKVYLVSDFESVVQIEYKGK
jgi:hypothetical protein